MTNARYDLMCPSCKSAVVLIKKGRRSGLYRCLGNERHICTEGEAINASTAWQTGSKTGGGHCK